MRTTQTTNSNNRFDYTKDMNSIKKLPTRFQIGDRCVAEFAPNSQVWGIVDGVHFEKNKVTYDLAVTTQPSKQGTGRHDIIIKNVDALLIQTEDETHNIEAKATL